MPSTPNPLLSMMENPETIGLPLVFIAFAAGIFIGFAIMKVRADQKKKRGG